ncbi:hypothetical protein NE237_020109 [Protea cynaroides]|uniref:Uncharacterized protein n=1 Tax=Protea cynaroides TaxID=273540 RepID=A0A9Q0K1C2_9MAGN|nr:hypothetical protein NE237_020109 [Protea cynaroides]
MNATWLPLVTGVLRIFPPTDLSHNALSRSIPQCLNNISFGRVFTIFEVFSEWVIHFLPNFGSDELLISKYYDQEIGESEEVEFIMRSRSNSYKGSILNFVSALDLSYNNFKDVILSEIGDLNGIVALNLSHNQLTGPIPRTLSNLTQIESLDLSYNKLSGEIPFELSILYSLEVFIFSRFSNNSYDGNPFLCGPPLSRPCSSITEPTNTSATTSIGVNGVDDIYMTAFFASFATSYVIFFLGFAVVLYINPYWQRMWFHFIENCIYSCHEFVSGT